MSSRWIRRALLVSVGLAFALPTQADDFVHCCIQDLKRRNHWPEPFVYSARQAAHAPFAAMVANGWQLQNMLAEQHFNNGSGQLTEAGRLKVLWVVNEAPEQHRIVFVHRGANPQETSARIGAVQELLAHSIYPGDPLIPVLETNRPNDGWPADRIDLIGRKFQAATPDPKLPSGGSGGGGSGGGGGSSGSSGGSR
jgi:uncharacterized membrane protein YgcG